MTDFEIGDETYVETAVEFDEQKINRDDDGKFAPKGGGNNYEKTTTKDLVKQIKGGSKNWQDWDRNENTEELYAELERRNKEVPKPTGVSNPKVFRDDPDAIPKMEQKIAYWQAQKDYWAQITKFPARDYHNRGQLGDAKWYEQSLVSKNLNDAKKKLELIKNQGTLTRNRTFKDGKPRFYYTEEPKSGEVNTSYDQDQVIGDEPNHYPAAGAEPIDAQTGDDFMDIKVGEEKLNKDGTGIKRATRGVNPNKPKNKVLRFEYVSNSDCEICKQYDGKSFTVDSPNRPIIPRLEEQGKKGGRPYTHPNCKCRWKNVFNENKIGATEEYKIQKILDGVVDNTYGTEQNDMNVDQVFLDIVKIIIKQKKKSLGMESYGVETAYDTVFDNITDELPHEVKEPWDGMNKTEYLETLSAQEGGRGSGKHGHQKWMLTGEANDECPNCMIQTDKDDDGKCILCGQ